MRDALEPYKVKLIPNLWSVLDSAKPEDASLLPAASALALYDPENTRWDKVGGKVAQAMVSVSPAYLTPWLKVLRPVRGRLTTPLASIFRKKNAPESQRSLATSILAVYASDQPTLLADLLMDTEESQFADLLFEKLKNHPERTVSLLEDELAKPSAEATAVAKDVLAQRQARAAVALVRLGQPKKVWPLLRHSPDPSVRSYIVNWLKLLGVDPKTLKAELESLDRDKAPTPSEGQSRIEAILFHPETSMRRALILALGQYGQEELSPGDRELLTSKLLDLYATDPDAGIHGAAEWMLRRWGQQDRLKERDNELMKVKDWGDRRWYVNGQGQTFAVIDGPVEFDMGSPPIEPERRDGELLYKRVIPRRFAIATKEVTVDQFRKFQQASPDGSDAAASDLKTYSPDPSGPMIVVTWYRAAAYCNWLSRNEGLPECYEPNDQGKLAEGMKIKADALQLPGYRLPTEAEWECACRAGAVTGRPYGRSTELLGKYAWYLQNSSSRAWPCGRLQPNDLGLFDMLGNVYEWCQGRGESYRPGRMYDDIDRYEYLKDVYLRFLRGGSFTNPPTNVRSADRYGYQPLNRDIYYGFRPARTYP